MAIKNDVVVVVVVANIVALAVSDVDCLGHLPHRHTAVACCWANNHSQLSMQPLPLLQHLQLLLLLHSAPVVHHMPRWLAQCDHIPSLAATVAAAGDHTYVVVVAADAVAVAVERRRQQHSDRSTFVAHNCR